MVEASSKTYRTREGEAWDEVAKALWGEERLLHLLLEANPEWREYLLFPGEVELSVPEVVSWPRPAM